MVTKRDTVMLRVTEEGPYIYIVLVLLSTFIWMRLPLILHINNLFT